MLGQPGLPAQAPAFHGKNIPWAAAAPQPGPQKGISDVSEELLSCENK